jgi:ferritin-like protein
VAFRLVDGCELNAGRFRRFACGHRKRKTRNCGNVLPGVAPAISSIVSVLRLESVMSSVGYHEPVEEMSEQTRDMHRAIVSLMEELEAVDWYNQRAGACKDEELKAILEHNRDEEKEHASMVLEWIRRKDPVFSKELKDYLFTEKSVAHR